MGSNSKRNYGESNNMIGNANVNPGGIFFTQEGKAHQNLQRMKSVRITWNHEGTNVDIAGSWDWNAKETLVRVGKSFVIVKTLPIGIYHYYFIVDGNKFTHAPESPFIHVKGSCLVYNVLDLQDYVPELQGRFADLEVPPSSPPSSYDNKDFLDVDYSRPPPELPPQLPIKIGDGLSSSASNIDVELNHLFISGKRAELRSTQRFGEKYVTEVYKLKGRGS